jgi:8-amino-7-oxononanoate synthase
LYQQLQELGLQLGPEPSPVVAVRVANIDQAIAFWKGLLEAGVYVNLVTPPATPDGGCLLRCSVSAGHSAQQIDRIVQAFAALCRTSHAVQAVQSG